MKIKRVGIDLDNTVADYLSAAAPLLKEHYGLVPDFTIPTHKIEDVFGITSETRPPDMRKKLYEDLHLFRNLFLLEPDIHKLPQRIFLQMAMQHQVNTKIYFITARTPTPTIVEDTIEWLSKHQFHFDDIFFVGDKAALCEMMHIDVMIEDEPFQANKIVETETKVVLRDQPWNREVPSSDNLVRVFNWRHALEATKEFMI